jgi:hypothetical protein
VTATIQADVGLFLATYIRREIRRPEMLAAYPTLEGFEVALVEPLVDSLDFPEKLIVVRDDGTSADPLLTGSTSVGVSVLMGDPGETTESSEAARVVHAIVRECARVEVGNPVAAVVASNGPYLVPETQPRARWYSTHELRTVETALGVDTVNLGDAPTTYVPVYDVEIPDLTLQFENGLI